MKVEGAIINKIDLVEYVGRDTELHRQGKEWRGCCPLHDGNNETSFAVYPNNTYYCFACGVGGNVINYVSEKEHLPYREAVHQLATELNIDIENDESYKKMTQIVSNNESIAEKGHRNVSKLQKYLSKRGKRRFVIPVMERTTPPPLLALPMEFGISPYIFD